MIELSIDFIIIVHCPSAELTVPPIIVIVIHILLIFFDEAPKLWSTFHYKTNKKKYFLKREFLKILRVSYGLIHEFGVIRF